MNNEEKYKRMSEIKDWCLTILNFLGKRVPQLLEFTELTSNTIIENTRKYNSKVFKGLSDGRLDICDMTSALPPKDFEILNLELKTKFGEDVNDYRNLLNIKNIVKRGRLKNDFEFRLIEDLVSNYIQESPNSEEITILNKLLLDYEKKRG